MLVFITIQGETCFIMCPDTSPHTRYERQISPFMPHWAGTWSWIIKTNRHGMTQNRTEEKGWGTEGKESLLGSGGSYLEILPALLHYSYYFLTASNSGVAEALFKCASSCLSWAPGRKYGLYNCLLDPGIGIQFWRQSMSGAQAPREADWDKDSCVVGLLGRPWDHQSWACGSRRISHTEDRKCNTGLSWSRGNSGARITLWSCSPLRKEGLCVPGCGLSLGRTRWLSSADYSLRWNQLKSHQLPALPEAAGMVSQPWGVRRHTTASASDHSQERSKALPRAKAIIAPCLACRGISL